MMLSGRAEMDVAARKARRNWREYMLGDARRQEEIMY